MRRLTEPVLGLACALAYYLLLWLLAPCEKPLDIPTGFTVDAAIPMTENMAEGDTRE